jgi:hypothetical protein
MIKIGSSRFVLLCGKFAIKIAYNRCGVEQNKRELEIWGKYKSPPFNKIYKNFFNLITIHRKLKQITNMQTRMWRKYVDAWINLTPELQFDKGKGDVYRKENWGSHNGIYLIQDYGLDKEIEKKYYNKLEK